MASARYPPPDGGTPEMAPPVDTAAWDSLLSYKEKIKRIELAKSLSYPSCKNVDIFTQQKPLFKV